VVSFCCYGGTRCLRGPFIADSALPDDGLVFPISINEAVGLSAPNNGDDVKTIQQALNRFPESMGGPTAKLKVDGIVGRFTLGAIEKFQRRQLGFTDSRIDPDKGAINRINELQLTVWVTVPDRTMEKIYKVILPQARECALAADAALLSARLWFLSPGTLSFTPPAVAMINRHFQLDKNPNAARDFELITDLFRNMLALFSRNVQGFEKTFAPAPGRFSLAEVLSSHVLAFCRPNGVNLRGVTLPAKARDRSDIQLPQDKIFIMPPFTFCSPDAQIDTLIHECGHFLGEPDGAPDTIDDPPDGSSDPENIAKQPPQKKPRLAECYAAFAFEAKFHRQPIIFIG
jgi:hypothetical protein